MALYYNNKFWFFDKLNKKTRNKDFELIRKLYISNIPTKLLSKEILAKKFRAYGEIESIELHVDKCFVEDHLSKHPNYAYVTFSDSASAHKALTAKNKKQTVFRKEPANTWKQPVEVFPEEIAIPSGENHFNRLDEYSLLEIFSLLKTEDLISLSQVSKRFNSLIHAKIFARTKELRLSCQAWTWTESELTLTQLRQILLSYGKYSERVTFRFPDSKNTERFAPRMVDLFTKHIGDNVVELKIQHLIITDRMVLQFKRLFERLKVLHWCGQSCYRYQPSTYTINYDKRDTDLITTCVNLEELKVTQKHEFIKNSGPWKKLKKIHIGFYNFVDIECYPDFFINNPQITHLKILVEYDLDILLEDIRTYLPDLEKLYIYGISNHVDIQCIQMLTSLQKLRVLKIDSILPETLNRLLQILLALPELEELSILILNIIRSSATHLTSLKTFLENSQTVRKFSLKGFHLPEDMIIDLIRYNRYLDFLGFNAYNMIPISAELLMNMCAAHEKSTRSNSGPINIGVFAFVDDEIDVLCTSEYVSKHIRLVKK